MSYVVRKGVLVPKAKEAILRPRFPLRRKLPDMRFPHVWIPRVVPARMAVAVDATGTKLIGGVGASSINYSGITVGSGLPNGALLATLVLGASGSTSNWAATWDSGGTNQAMTVVKSLVTGGVSTAVMLGLLNPTAGNKTLALSWTNAGAAQFPVVEAQSYTGVTQASIAAAFANANSGSTSSLIITSAIGDLAVALIATSSTLTSLNQTSIYLDTTSNGCDSAASRAAGASSVTFTATGAAGSIAMVGVDLVAAGGAAFTAPPNKPILQAVKRASYF